MALTIVTILLDIIGAICAIFAAICYFIGFADDKDWYAPATVWAVFAASCFVFGYIVNQ